MNEAEIRAYLSTVWHEDEILVLPPTFGLTAVEELTADLIKQVETTKNNK